MRIQEQHGPSHIGLMQVNRPTDSTPINLLLVDDDAEFLEMLGEFLGREGFNVSTAMNMDRALHHCVANEPDVIVTDLHMPGGSGVTLFQQLKSRALELPPTVFLTGVSDISLRNTYLQGADIVLQKPVQPKELADTLKYLYEKRRSQKIAHEDLIDLRDRLVSVDKLVSLGIMASEIAHEIKGSLTIIQGNNLLMKSIQITEPKEQERVDHYTRRIEDAIFRISKIIQEVQKLSGEEVQEPHEMLSVRSLTFDVLALCGDYLRSKSVIKRVDEIPEDMKIRGSSIQLSQLLVNLIQNACDAIEKQDEKWIHLKWSDHPNEVVFSITDSGQGISEALQEHIFRPFFTTKPVGKGTGLGLSIAAKILNAHSGTIMIDKECPNTRFLLSFPK